MRNFIFDFNGTLFRDSPMLMKSWQLYLGQFGINVTEEMFHKYMCGPPNTVTIKHYIGEGRTDEEIRRMGEEKELFYRKIILDDPSLQHLIEGAPEMFDMLKARGVPFAIATGSIRSNCDFYIEVLHIDKWFDYDHIFYAEGDLPGKPDPAIYRLAMQKLGFKPEETVVVEDSLIGIESAVGAGVKSVIAIDSTMGAEAFHGIPEVIDVIHNYRNFERFL